MKPDAEEVKDGEIVRGKCKSERKTTGHCVVLLFHYPVPVGKDLAHFTLSLAELCAYHA